MPPPAALLRETGIEPLIRHADELAAARNPAAEHVPRNTPMLVRRILLIAVVLVFAIQMLRYLHIV